MPLSLIIEIAVSALMGCAVGWVTNAVAIKMLFKKYWKWGGVIKEHYGDFIKNMSQLVEDDLVNGRTLQQEFSSERFKAVLRKWVGDILKKELPENSGGLRLQDIPDIDNSAAGVIALFDKTQPALIDGLYKTLSREKIKALVSQEHYAYLINTNIATIFTHKGDYEYKIQNALAAFLKNKPFNALISDRAIRIIAENIGALIQKIDFSRYDGDLDNAYHDLLAALEIDRLIKDLQNDLSRMRFSDFVNNTQKLSRDLIKWTLDFIRSPEGQTLLNGIISEFLNDARRIDLKIGDIVSASVKDSIISFCNNKMPVIIDNICAFIRDTQNEIEEIVNKTVDSQLDRTIGGKIGKFLKDIFVDNLAGKVNVIGKIIEALRQYGDQAGAELSKQIIKLLETQTIGQIIGAILDAGLIDIQSIMEFINKNLKNLENKEFNFIDKLLDKQIGEAFGVIDLSIIKTKLLPRVFAQIKQEYLYNERFKRDAGAIIVNKFAELAGKTVSDFFDVSEIKIDLNSEKIKTSLLGLWGAISETAINVILGKDVHIPNINRRTFENIWYTNKNRELNELYGAAQNDATYRKIAGGLIDILNQNLDKLLTGNVSSLVNSELSKLEPDQINDMVQDFMGKEMKSINILGAALGLIIGGASAFAASLLKVPSNFSGWMLAVYGAIFALVGIGTNWLAIKMLFKPYQGLFPGAKIPPFIGIVPARKPEFAKNIGSFVKQKLLNESALTDFFTANKGAVKNGIFQRLSGENYAVIDAFFGDNERLEYISNAVFHAIQSYITEHRGEITGAIANALKKLSEDGKLYDLIPVLRDTIITKLKESDAALALTNLIKKETEGKKFGAYKKAIANFADIQLQKFFEVIAQDLTRELTLDKVKKLIAEQNDQFISYIQNNTIAGLVGDHVIEDFTQKIAKQVGPLLDSGIEPLVKSLEKEEFNPNKKLNEVFGGALTQLLNKNIRFIIDMVSGEVGKVRGTLTGEIKAALPFYALPWGGHIAPIVDALIDKELPAFLRRKQTQLEEIAARLLSYRLSDIGFTNNTLQMDTIKRTITSVLESPHIQQGVSHFAGILIKQLSELPIKTLLGLINIKNINDFVRVIEPLLSTTVDRVKDSLSKDEIRDVMVKLAKDILMKIIDQVTIEELLNNIELEKELRALVSQLVNDSAVMRELSDMVEDALRAIEREPSFFNGDILRKDMADFIVRFGEENGWERLRDAVQPAFKDFFLNINAALTVETKNAICADYLLAAIINSAGYNFPDAIRSIDVQVVVEREINNMHPAGIEKLFYKFAGEYFKKITLYGWIGLFGGLLSYLVGCALTIALRR